MIFTVHLVVTLKPVVNDPQGLVVQSGLRQLGFGGVSAVRVGKYIELNLDAPDEATARAQATEMCERLLRNPVIEDYEIKGMMPAGAVHGADGPAVPARHGPPGGHAAPAGHGPPPAHAAAPPGGPPR